ncbi:response regulator transcription factor [Lentimicrobium sp. L6]|uniref:response regulator transcription factor n=1 Tax=Lentimicrobium sp. L6 TaxID=2735916 RepID=UPI00155495E2|nr:response regulator transcription factor [Lentimicrobium sp. L6]NPD83562.1 response regulator transcription factor [Lentimicrobium sp. L6]
MKLTKILIVDDHDITLHGLSKYIEKIENTEIVGMVKSGEEALDLIQENKPDIVFTDVDMPVMDGVELLKLIRKDFVNIKVIACTMHIQLWVIQKLLHHGINGIISKQSLKIDIAKAVDRAITDHPFYSSDIYEAVIEIMKKPADYFSRFDELDLTKREKQVLQLISDELTSVEIAEKLFLSPNTIESHRKNLFLKFGVKNVAGLIKKAMERQLIE